MRVTIRVKAIEWGDQFLLWSNEDKPVYPGVDGAVRYELKFYRTDEEIAEIRKTSPDFENPYVCDLYRQPFSRKGPYQQEHPASHVWGWDGNREAPTLTPSFMLSGDPAFKVHLFFQAGKINLLPDSTVTLEGTP